MNPRDVQREKIFTRRAVLLGLGQLGLVGVLGARLVYLQVMEATKYAVLADENRISPRLLPPQRGRILDRNGEPLAVNRLTYRAVVVPEQVRNLDATLDALAQLVGLSDADRRRFYRDMKGKRSFMPIAVREDLSWDELAKLELNAPFLPGVSIEVGQTRLYPHTESVGHILGYVGAVSEAEMDDSDDPLLEVPGFRIGKNGIERTHDDDLRGEAGDSEIEVDAVGRVIRELDRTEPTPGKDLELTLDIGIQEFARARIGEEAAAAVCMDAHSGEVIAMVSAPAFDPNMFSTGLKASDWEEFLANPKKPLLNKAIAGLYSPGSTFKMVTALAGLDAGVITPETALPCTGEYHLGNAIFHCWRWKQGGHGMVQLTRALAASCDCYFYEVARRVGIDKIAAMARRMGFGQRLGIDIPGEKPGIIPTTQWKRATYGQSWGQGETVSCGIGQSYVTVTPLQLATMTARLANGGRAVVPRLTRRIGGQPPTDALKVPAQIGLNPAHLKAVLGGMVAVCEVGGTGYSIRITEPGMEMAGKSGSAQVRRITMAERAHGLRRDQDIPWAERDNAFFVAFAPVHAPRFACAVAVEHGLHGADAAGPIARDILLEVQRRNLGPVAAVAGGTQMARAE